jgi:hypothetical protein
MKFNETVIKAFSRVLDRSEDEISSVCQKSKDPASVAKNYRMNLFLGLHKITTTEYRWYPTVAQFVKTHPKGRFFAMKNTQAFAIIDGTVYTDGGPEVNSRSRICDGFEAVQKLQYVSPLGKTYKLR